MSPRKKIPKVREFTKLCLDEGITSPSVMRDKYNDKYPIKRKGVLAPKSSDAFRKAIRRLGVSAEKRLEMKHEALKSKELRDISEYDEVRKYLDFSKYGASPITSDQIEKTMRNLRQLWTWMSAEGHPNPLDWTIKMLGECMEKNIGRDESGGWKYKNRILDLYGAYNRTFQGKLPKGWSAGLKRPAGELKDFFEYAEMQDYLDHLTDTEKLSREGWDALACCQVCTGAREGTQGDTGILSLRWEDIKWNSKRCDIRDKGKKGMRKRLWTNVPLDLFPWLNAWEKLCRFHEQTHGYRPSQSNHAEGKVWKVTYPEYLYHFHKTRRSCTSRIKGNAETLVPHIFRKTHAQYSKRLGITIENLCGDTKGGAVCDGRYGVGWSNPNVPLKYYLTREEWEYVEQDEKIEERLRTRVLPQIRGEHDER